MALLHLRYNRIDCSYDETLAVSGSGRFTFRYLAPYLYVIDSDEGTGNYDSVLKIYDMANPFGPVLVSTTAMGDKVNAINPYPVGNLLYVVYSGDYVSSARKLAIWDVSDRTAPVEIGSHTFTDGQIGTIANNVWPSSVAVIDDIACVSIGGSALNAADAVKINVSNPASPSYVAGVLLNSPFSSRGWRVIPVLDNFVMCGHFHSPGATTVGVIDPSSWTIVDARHHPAGGVGTGASHIAATADGAYLYTSPTNTGELWTLDISDPSDIVTASQVNGMGVGGLPNSMLLIEEIDRLYIGRANGGGLQIHICDVTDRATPVFVGSISTSLESVSDLAKIDDGCAGLAWGQGTGAAIHLLGSPPLS